MNAFVVDVFKTTFCGCLSVHRSMCMYRPDDIQVGIAIHLSFEPGLEFTK